jgi:hypothetical protein
MRGGGREQVDAARIQQEAQRVPRDLDGHEHVVAEQFDGQSRIVAASHEGDVGEGLGRDVEDAGRRRLVDRDRRDLDDALEAGIAVPAGDAHRQAQPADIAVILEAPQGRLAQHLLRQPGEQVRAGVEPELDPLPADGHATQDVERSAVGLAPPERLDRRAAAIRPPPAARMDPGVGGRGAAARVRILHEHLAVGAALPGLPSVEAAGQRRRSEGHLHRVAAVGRLDPLLPRARQPAGEHAALEAQRAHA